MALGEEACGKQARIGGVGHSELSTGKMLPTAVLGENVLQGLLLHAVSVGGEQEERILLVQDSVGLFYEARDVFFKLPYFFLGPVAPAGWIGEDTVEAEILVIAGDEKTLGVLLGPADTFDS